MSTKSNYSEAQSAWLVKVYTVDFASDSNRMDEIADLFNAEFGTELKVPSFRGKIMSINGADGNSIYVPMVKPVKVAKDTGPTKKEILVSLQEIVGSGFDAFKLQGATKEGIEGVSEYIQELLEANA